MSQKIIILMSQKVRFLMSHKLIAKSTYLNVTKIELYVVAENIELFQYRD